MLSSGWAEGHQYRLVSGYKHNNLWTNQGYLSHLVNYKLSGLLILLDPHTALKLPSTG